VDLIVVRHARPVRQVVEEGEGADPELSEVGLEQAARTADFLVGEGIDHVVSSTMLRARQTAQPLAEKLGLEVEQVDDLKESDHRSNAYVPSEEMSPDDPATAHYFHGNLHDAVFSDGYGDFEHRVVRGFQHVIDTQRSKRVAVFCHGMVTMVYLRTILGIDDVFSLTVDYCGINRIRAASSGARTVRSVNETHHVRDLIDWDA
jgi:probable phosphoglycerate mutase